MQISPSICTYTFTTAEDYRWQWASFATGAASAVYVFLYSIYYFFTKTRMHGLMQTSFFFGYIALFSTALALLGGTVGHAGANIFVKRIYANIKSD
jgi:transmembrane 9 superfamily protein 3